MTMAPSLVTRHWHRVPSVHGTHYPASAWLIQLRAYAMPSVPVPSVTSLTDMVARCRPLAAHGLRSCPSVRTQPLTATGAPSRTSTMPCHARHHQHPRQSETNPNPTLMLDIRCLTSKMTRKKGPNPLKNGAPMRCFSANRGPKSPLRDPNRFQNARQKG